MTTEPFTAQWYRNRAEEVRHNGEKVSKCNHFLGIAEALVSRDKELEELREEKAKLEHISEMDDRRCTENLRELSSLRQRLAEEERKLAIAREALKVASIEAERILAINWQWDGDGGATAAAQETQDAATQALEQTK